MILLLEKMHLKQIGMLELITIEVYILASYVAVWWENWLLLIRVSRLLP